jgi:thiamine transport system ATP-binding protein
MVGPSGGGKSTLRHAIAGFERPAGGSPTFGGIDLLPLKPAAWPVGIVFQDHNLPPNLTAQQNAGLALSPALRLSPTHRPVFAARLEHVGLAGMGERLLSELSGDQRQRPRSPAPC